MKACVVLWCMSFFLMSSVIAFTAFPKYKHYQIVSIIHHCRRTTIWQLNISKQQSMAAKCHLIKKQHSFHYKCETLIPCKAPDCYWTSLLITCPLPTGWVRSMVTCWKVQDKWPIWPAEPCFKFNSYLVMNHWFGSLQSPIFTKNVF